MRSFSSHGDGSFHLSDFKHLGTNVVFECGVKVWNAHTVSIGDNVYIGHNTFLKGHTNGTFTIDSNTWIGQNCFFHSAGNIHIESEVGIGPNVSMLTSSHDLSQANRSILESPLIYKAIHVGFGSDIGVSSILLPGVRIGRYAQVGAGSIVTQDVSDNSIVAGNPAKLIRMRA